jgi:hypothetical protein
MSISIRADEYLRTAFKRDVLSHILAMNVNHKPTLRWYMEKADGSFDTSDGTNVAAGVALAAADITIYVEGT